jgi:hypothetical protein
MDRLSLTLVTFLAAAPALAAQTAPNACGLLTKAEVDQLIDRGKVVSGTPTAISVSGGKGSVCVYSTAMVGIYAGPNSHATFEPTLRAYKITEQDKKPVAGIGDKAYMFYHRSKNPVDHGTYLVMTVGTYTVTVQIAAHVGEAEGWKAAHCKFPADLTADQKADCDKAMADKSEPPESVAPAVQELGKVVAAKVRAGKF